VLPKDVSVAASMGDQNLLNNMKDVTTQGTGFSDAIKAADPNKVLQVTYAMPVYGTIEARQFNVFGDNLTQFHTEMANNNATLIKMSTMGPGKYQALSGKGGIPDMVVIPEVQ
jgi:hypothetical protein